MSLKFVFNNNDPVYMMRYKLEQSLSEIKKDDYDLVLKFMNDLFKTKNKSLKDFKNIDIRKLDIDYAIEIIEKHKIIKKYKINIDEDDITTKTIVDIIKTILNPLEYTFSKRQINSIYYVKEKQLK